jgi:tetratricopeptide (TPR) repeat protein
MEGLAELQDNQEQKEEAEVLKEAELEAHVKLCGETHGLTIVEMDNLAVTHVMAKR